MIDKKTVFILGAGASCAYGYPSGAHLRQYICLSTNRPVKELVQAIDSEKGFGDFRKKFEDSSTKSIDLFMARNPKLAPVGKCIIAYEIFIAENRSQFRERAEREQERRKCWQGDITSERLLQRNDFQGGDWYSYLFDRLTVGLVGKEDLPDFSEGKVSFVTFNYDRSWEYFLYESLRNSFTEVPEPQVIKCLENLKILHVYGQIAPLKWQDSNQGVDYRPPISKSLLQSAASNIRTIYEEKQNQQLTEAQNVLSRAEQIFFLGFGYAPENMEVLGLPGAIPPDNCRVYGSAYGLEKNEIEEVRNRIVTGLPGGHTVANRHRLIIENVDCLKLLRNHL